MADILLRLAPIFFFFGIGVVLRQTGLAQKSDGDFVLRLAFFVTLPLLILLTLEQTTLSADKIWLPVANIEPNPVNLDPRWVKVSSGVQRLEGNLLVILDVAKILDMEDDKVAA